MSHVDYLKSLFPNLGVVEDLPGLTLVLGLNHDAISDSQYYSLIF